MNMKQAVLPRSSGTGARAHRRSERRGRARLPDGLCTMPRARPPTPPMRASARRRARAARRRDRQHQGSVRRRRRADARRLENPRRGGAAGEADAADRAPAARGRRRDRRQDQHDRIRLLRHRRQSAFRHAGQSARPHPGARRLLGRRAGRRGRRHVRHRASAPTPAAPCAFRRRCAASSASSRAGSACRPTARFR